MKKKGINKVLKKVLSVALIASLFLTGCGNGSAGGSTGSSAKSEKGTKESLETVRVGVMTGIIEHYIAIVGQEKGIWEKNGIDLQVTEFATGVEAVGAVQTEQIDVAEIMDFAIINRLGTTADKTNLRIYNLNYESDTSDKDSIAVNKFYVNPKTVKDASDLKGKKISVALGTVNEYFVAEGLAKAGLTVKDVTTVPADSITANIAMAANGEIDGTWASGTTASKLVDDGWVALYNAIDLDLLTRDIGVTTDSFATTETLKKYVKARDEVVKYIEENEEDAVKIIADKSSLDQEVIRTTIEGNNLEPEFSNDTVDQLNKLKDWALKNGNLKKDFTLDNFIDLTAVKDAVGDRVTYEK